MRQHRLLDSRRSLVLLATSRTLSGSAQTCLQWLQIRSLPSQKPETVWRMIEALTVALVECTRLTHSVAVGVSRWHADGQARSDSKQNREQA
jgi:hypothetical protein